MKSSVAIVTLLVALLEGAAMAGTPSDLEVTVTPLRDVFHLGEPIALSVSLTNTTDKPIEIVREYPLEIGMSFTCKDVSPPKPAPFIQDVSTPLARMGPKQDIKCVIALNRYLAFAKTGKYSASYQSMLLGRTDEDKEQRGKYFLQDYKAKGTVNITIETGAIDAEWIKELTGVLEQKGTATATLPNDAKPKVSREEAAELLQWADTPLVIEALIAAAKDKDLRNMSDDIVESLQKFFKEHERARTGILEIAKTDMAAFQAALAVYEKEGVTIPSAWFKPTLASMNTASIWMSLQYLKKHGKKEDAELVEPLTKSKNEQIAGLAKQVAEELKAKKPPATLPTTVPETN